MSIIYIRRLYEHELGYRHGEARGAGPFIYVSKAAAQNFFPPLSDRVLNDHLFLELNLPNLTTSVLAQYVYHNDRHIIPGGSRDEFRLYLTPLIAIDSRFRTPENIVVFESMDIPDRKIFSVRLFSPIETPDQYGILNSVLGGERHKLISSTKFSFLRAPEPVAITPTISDEIMDVALADPVAKETRKEATVTVTRIVREAAFRMLVVKIYDFRCAVTNTSIRHNAKCNIQACHIIPASKSGSDHPVNGIALSLDMHWAFDWGFFTLNENYEVIIHPEADSLGILNEKARNRICLPADERAWPHPESLEWHRENVFGRFMRS
jgi:hypothetical protein